MNIRIKKACKEYNGKEVLYIDELYLEEGRIYALMGLNGSGKSTLLQCVSGLEEFTKGEVIYDEAYNLDLARHNISVMLQKPYLFNCSVIKNIKMGLKLRKQNKINIEERIRNYLSYFDIDELLNKNSRQLSGGEQERVALLRTAVLETEVTFLDEPTASMDIENTLKAEKLIKAMVSEKRTVVIVTHDLLQAERVADYVIFLDKGRIIEQGEREKVFKNPKHKLLKQILKRNDDND